MTSSDICYIKVVRKHSRATCVVQTESRLGKILTQFAIVDERELSFSIYRMQSLEPGSRYVMNSSRCLRCNFHESWQPVLYTKSISSRVYTSLPFLSMSTTFSLNIEMHCKKNGSWNSAKQPDA